MNDIKISVIIPVYNTEKYLEECIESVLAQDMSDIEVICINDGSTDKSGNILEMYKRRDSRIKVIEQENKGQSSARNKGMDSAKGKYICFLDSDDVLNEGALKKMYKCAEEHMLDIFCFDANCIYENEKLHKKEYKDEFYSRKKSYGGPIGGREMFCELIENDDYSDATWLIFVCRDLLINNDIRFYEGIIHEDALFCFKCMMNGTSVMHINEKLVKYRIRENSTMTSKMSCASLHGRLVCYIEILKYILNIKLTEREKQAIAKLENFIAYNIKWTDIRLDDLERAKYSPADHIEDIISMAMGVGEEKTYDFSECIYERGFLSLINDSDEIVLYGAGKIGQKVYDYISKCGYGGKIKGYVVSDNAKIGNSVNGVPVEQIEQINRERNVLLIICARRDYQEAMLSRASVCGYTNIERIDTRLEYIIDKRIG